MSLSLQCSQGHAWEPAPVTGLAPGQALACLQCGAPPTLASLGLPAGVAQVIHRLQEELTKALQTQLSGLLLYGGIVRGRYRPGRSDVNLVVVLQEGSASVLEAAAGPLRTAWRAARVEPLLLTVQEVQRAADAFATKFLDIQLFHVVLAGTDPFLGLKIATDDLWLRVEQELRNLSLRLRRRFVAIHDSPVEMTTALLQIARPLAIELETLLRLHGKPLPAEDRTAAVYAAAAAAFGLDGDNLARLARLRQDQQLAAEEDCGVLYRRILETVARAADCADRRERQP